MCEALLIGQGFDVTDFNIASPSNGSDSYSFLNTLAGTLVSVSFMFMLTVFSSHASLQLHSVPSYLC